MNLLTLYFHNFDPMKDKIPNDYFVQLPQIFKRARRLLKGRTSKEICEANQAIDWIVDQHLKQKSSKECSSSLSKIIIPTLNIFESKYHEYELENYTLFPNAKDYEYFAALALLEGYNAIFYSKTKNPLSKYIHNIDSMIVAGNHTVAAMEAVCLAEYLADKELQINFTKHAIKVKKRLDCQRAAIERHAATKRLKEETLRLFLIGNYRSAREAAKHLYPKIQSYAKENNITPLLPISPEKEEIHRTVYQWCLEFSKNLQK